MVQYMIVFDIEPQKEPTQAIIQQLKNMGAEAEFYAAYADKVDDKILSEMGVVSVPQTATQFSNEFYVCFRCGEAFNLEQELLVHEEEHRGVGQ